MNIEEFRATLRGNEPPASLPPLLAALWWDAAGNFDRAHEIAQDESLGRDAAWIHAYLHRKEGDPGNAGYWYRQARQPHAQTSFEDEWREIATALLEHQPRK